MVNKLVKKLRKSPNLKARDVFEHFKMKYGVELGKSKIYRSTLQARAIVEGSEHEQFAKLWDYCHELERANLRSSITLDTLPQTDSNLIFHRLYVCIAGCKEGFKAGYRPMIGLDGAFLKGYYGGHLLSAVGQDANNHIWPIAYAIVDSENKENWSWFLKLLHLDLGDFRQHNWHFISDMQKLIYILQTESLIGMYFIQS